MVECRHLHFWIANSAVYRTPPCTALENATPVHIFSKGKEDQNIPTSFERFIKSFTREMLHNSLT